MDRWHVQLLGGFQVRRGTQVVHKFRTRAVDNLFGLLAVNLGTPQRREVLIEAIWPDGDPHQGSQNLRTGIHNVRAVLGAECVLADRRVVELNPEYFVVDAVEFRQTRDPDAYLGRACEGMTGTWAWSVAQDLEDLFVESVSEILATLPAPEAAERGAEYMRRHPNVLAIRAKMRELSGSHTAPSAAAPTHLTTFIGRAAEMQGISRLLDAFRVVTLTGHGGSGKTRVAAELWRLHQPASWFISLADVRTPELIGDVIRDRLRIPVSSQASSVEQIVAALSELTGLVVLDNFEHLQEAAFLVPEVVTRCPGIRVLITSRVPLGIEGGAEFAIGPLPVTAAATVAASESARLFEAKASVVCPGFALNRENVDDVEELCRRLDGFPLALELAAAKSRLFTPSEMLSQIDHRFDFLQRYEGRVTRQSSLLQTLDWSFDRLSEPCQDLLCRLAVFEGGFNLLSAVQVCGADPSGDQVDALLSSDWIKRSESDKRTRFRLLESVRDYGLSLLGQQEGRRLRAAHAEFYTRVAEECFDATYRPEEPEHFALVRTDLANIEAAWHWQCGQGGEGMLRLANGVDWFFRQSGLSALGEKWLKEAIARSSDEPRRLLTASYHSCATLILTQQKYEESIDWSRRTHRMAVATDDTRYLGLSMMQMAFASAELGRYDDARHMAADSISHLISDENQNWLAAAYTVSALIGNRSGDVEFAERMGRLAVDCARQGGYPWAIASALNELAMTGYLTGDFESSIAHQLESIEIKDRLQALPSLALSRADLAATYLAAGQEELAIDQLAAWADLVEKSDDAEHYPRAIGTAAELLARCDPALAHRLLHKMRTLLRGDSMNACDRRVYDGAKKALAGTEVPAVTNDAGPQIIAAIRALSTVR